MIGDVRLAEPGGGDYGANVQRSAAQGSQDRQTRRIGKAAEQLCLEIKRLRWGVEKHGLFTYHLDILVDTDMMRHIIHC